MVARYYKEPPASAKERIEYLAPKTDWNVSKAAVISVLPEDRAELQLRQVFTSLRDDTRPVVWKSASGERRGTRNSSTGSPTCRGSER